MNRKPLSISLTNDRNGNCKTGSDYCFFSLSLCLISSFLLASCHLNAFVLVIVSFLGSITIDCFFRFVIIIGDYCLLSTITDWQCNHCCNTTRMLDECWCRKCTCCRLRRCRRRNYYVNYSGFTLLKLLLVFFENFHSSLCLTSFQVRRT